MKHDDAAQVQAGKQKSVVLLLLRALALVWVMHTRTSTKRRKKWRKKKLFLRVEHALYTAAAVLPISSHTEADKCVKLLTELAITDFYTFYASLYVRSLCTRTQQKKEIKKNNNLKLNSQRKILWYLLQFFPHFCSISNFCTTNLLANWVKFFSSTRTKINKLIDRLFLGGGFLNLRKLNSIFNSFSWNFIHRQSYKVL